MYNILHLNGYSCHKIRVKPDENCHKIRVNPYAPKINVKKNKKFV
jgi:hypothetical protein